MRKDRREGGRGGEESRSPTFSSTPRSEEKPRRRLETRDGEIQLKPAPLPSPPSAPSAQARLCSRSDTHNLGINKVRRAESAALSDAHPCVLVLLLPLRTGGGGAGGVGFSLDLFF